MLGTWTLWVVVAFINLEGSLESRFGFLFGFPCNLPPTRIHSAADAGERFMI